VHAVSTQPDPRFRRRIDFYFGEGRVTNDLYLFASFVDIAPEVVRRQSAEGVVLAGVP
jgi:hypothetical protein